MSTANTQAVYWRASSSPLLLMHQLERSVRAPAQPPLQQIHSSSAQRRSNSTAQRRLLPRPTLSSREAQQLGRLQLTQELPVASRGLTGRTVLAAATRLRPQRQQQLLRESSPGSLAALLAAHQQHVRLQQQQQQQQHASDSLAGPSGTHKSVPDGAEPASAAAPTDAETHRLQRKLTCVLRDSAVSATDVADVLFAAATADCLNAVHVAAALATLARLQAAQQAEAAAVAAVAGHAAAVDHSLGLAEADGAEQGDQAGWSEGAHGPEPVLAAVVPITAQQSGQMDTVRAAGATFVANHSNGANSRWHIPALQPGLAATAADQAQQGPGEASDEQEQQQQQHLVEQLGLAVVQLLPSMAASNVTSCCWSLAVLQAEPPDGLLGGAGAALLAMADSLSDISSTSTSSGSDGGGGHGQQPLHVVLQASPQQVVVLLWSLAKLTSNPDDCASYQHFQHQQQQQGLHSGDTVHTSSEAGSVGSGRLLLVHVLSRLVPHLQGGVTSQGLLMTLWAAATWNRLRHAQHSNTSTSNTAREPGSGAALPDAVCDALLSATEAAIHSQALAPRGLAVCVWAAARLGLCPTPSWLAAWLAGMHAALPATEPQDVAMSAWGLCRLFCPPPSDWLAALCHRAGQLAHRMAPRELAPLLWAFARLHFRPALPVLQALLQRGGQLAGEGRLGPQELGLLLWAPSVLQLQLPSCWMDGVLAAAGGYLPLFRPREASCLLVSLARLQHIPPGAWMRVWWAGSLELLVAAEGRQLVLLLWATVRLGQAPPRGWLQAWLDASCVALQRGQVSAQGFGLMWDGLAQLTTAGPAAAEVLLRHNTWWAAYWAASSQPDVLHSMGPLTAERMLVGLAAAAAAAEEFGIAPRAERGGAAASDDDDGMASHIRLSQQHDDLVMPPAWLHSFLAASQQLLPRANRYNLVNMMQAAADLGLALPPTWLAAAMARLQHLLVLEGVLHQHDASKSDDGHASGSHGSSSSSRSSIVGHGRSLALSARLQRRWLQVCLRQLVLGLRVQQLLAPPAQWRLWHRASLVAAGATAAEVAAQAAAAGGASSTVGGGSSSSSDVLFVWPWLADAVYATWVDKRDAQQTLQSLYK